MELKRGYITKLARCAGITQGYVSSILVGRKRPQYPAAKRLAAATGTDPIIWLEGTPEEIKSAIEAAELERLRRITEMADAETELLQMEGF